MRFTLSKVVSGRNQELKGQLDIKGRSGNTQVLIMANEKKAGYGTTEASFLLECQLSGSGDVFVLISRLLAPGKYHPVYKTECAPKEQGRYEFGVIIDTDTLCDGKDDKEIMV
jgi:hypothetical protein